MTASVVWRISRSSFGNWQQDRGEPHDRQLLDRKQRGQPFPRHGAAADAVELNGIAEALAQHLHQAGAEPVAGFLGRDQEDPAPDAGRWRAGLTRQARDEQPGAIGGLDHGLRIDDHALRRRQPQCRQARRRAAPSTVRGPTVGRSKRKSWPLFGAFTSTPRPAAGANAPCSRSRATAPADRRCPRCPRRRRHGRRSQPTACPISNGLSARSTLSPPRDIGHRLRRPASGA